MGDKDVKAVLAPFAASVATERDRATRIITTRVEDSPRAMAADRLAEHWREAELAAGTSAHEVIATPDPDAALQAALAGGDGGPIVVAGSLYLVGALRARLVDDPRLRDPED